MTIELILQNQDTGKAYDISEITESVEWFTQMEEQPGKLTFSIRYTGGEVIASPGAIVRFKVSGQNVFFGYVFKYEKNEAGRIQFTAYDQLRYLKNEDMYVFSGMTADGIFGKICSDFGVQCRVVHPSRYVVPDKVFSNKTKLSAMIQYGIDQTLNDTGEWYLIRDNFGVLEFLSVNKLKTNLAIGDASLLTSYTFSASIDDAANQIKLGQDNKDTKKRDTYIVKDSGSINQWGLLQHFEKVNEKMNEAQIVTRAEMLLKSKNKVKKSLKLECLGDFRVFPGVGIVLLISDLQRDTVYKGYALIEKVTHSFANCKHTMSIDVREW